MFFLNTLPIHLHIGNPQITFSDGVAVVTPNIFDKRHLGVRFTLRTADGKLVQEWEIPDDRPFILVLKNNYLTCSDAEKNEIPGKFSQSTYLDDLYTWYIVEMRITDPQTGVYHAPYAVLFPTDASFSAWKKISSNFLKNNDSSNNKSIVHIYSRNISKHDAVGNHTLALSSFLQGCDFNVQMHAHDFSLNFAGLIRSPEVFFHSSESSATLFYQYSITDNFFPFFCSCAAKRKILYYHNVTPGFWFSSCFPEFAELLDAAVTQYPLFSQFDAVIANSQFSLDQIRPYLRPDAETLVFPPYFSLSRVQGAEEPVPAEFSARHALLWVGRITPHKRPELALRIADELVRSGVDISLTFVGGGRYDFPAFAQHLQACLEDLDPRTRERIRFLEGLTDEQLTWLYRHSDLLLCTSAHEGYCMPLAEAAACGLPVAAMPQPAVLETLNGGGIVLSEDPAGAAGQIATFLETADEAERRASIPVLKPLPTDALLRLIIGEK